MKLNKLPICILLIVGAIIVSPFETKAHSYDNCYKNSQEQIGILRKGNSGIKIVDKNGQPLTGRVSVRMNKATVKVNKK